MQAVPYATVSGIRLFTHDAVGSTNAEALALARAGLREPAWIIADQQTEGRGRRGRSWASPPGNLYASLLLIDPCTAEVAPQLSFVAGLAVHDAVSVLAPQLTDRLLLKWPNDLLLDHRKLAGILVEGERLADGLFAAVVGIGLNCRSHPQALPSPTTDLAVAGVPVAPRDLLEFLGCSLGQRLSQWDRGRAFADIRGSWLQRTWRVGEPITVRSPEEVSGCFAGLDPHGRLMLKTHDSDTLVVSAGDVSLAPQPAEAL